MKAMPLTICAAMREIENNKVPGGGSLSEISPESPFASPCVNRKSVSFETSLGR
jgi:hypothetical protein